MNRESWKCQTYMEYHDKDKCVTFRKPTWCYLFCSIGRGSGYSGVQLEEWCQGGSLVVAGKEVEMISSLSAEAFKSGRCFHDDDHAVPTGAVKPGQ